MSRRKFAVFDIDGTLVRWQLYHAVTDRLLKSDHIDPEVLRKLKQVRLSWKTRASADSFHDYEQHLVHVYESLLPHINISEYNIAVDAVVEQYKDQVYSYTRDLITQLKTEGYFLLAISGSQVELVEKLAQHYEFDDWAGTIYHHDGSQFTGEKFIAAFNKKQLLQEMIEKHDLTTSGSYAVGDSASDIPMLELVENPIAFNPNQDLFEKAKQEAWKIVVERKNVVYKLSMNQGNSSNYRLTD